MREGRWIQCCSTGFEVGGGHSFMLGSGVPEPCHYCEGNGRLWQYPNGSLALYPGGPLKGWDSTEDPEEHTDA